MKNISTTGKITNIEFYLLVFLVFYSFLATYCQKPSPHLHNTISFMFPTILYAYLCYMNSRAVLFVTIFFRCIGNSLKARNINYISGLLNTVLWVVHCTRAPHCKRCLTLWISQTVIFITSIVCYMTARYLEESCLFSNIQSVCNMEGIQKFLYK